MSYLDQRRAFIEAGRPLKEKKIYHIPKVNEKRKQKIKEQENSDTALDKWFEERRKEMIGRCVFCGGKTEKDNDATYRCSIAHLLAKRKDYGCPSVNVHPD